MPFKHVGISASGGCCCGACVVVSGCGGTRLPLSSGAIVTVKQGSNTISSGIADGYLTSVSPSAFGSGYSHATVTVTGDGTGAKVIATFAAGKVTGYTVVKGGSGYTSATVSVSGDGSGAAALAVVGGHFCAPFSKGQTYQITASLPPKFADHTVSFTWDGAAGDVAFLTLSPASDYVCCISRCVYPLPKGLDLTDGGGFHAGLLGYCGGDGATYAYWSGGYGGANGPVRYTFVCGHIQIPVDGNPAVSRSFAGLLQEGAWLVTETTTQSGPYHDDGSDPPTITTTRGFGTAPCAFKTTPVDLEHATCTNPIGADFDCTLPDPVDSDPAIYPVTATRYAIGGSFYGGSAAFDCNPMNAAFALANLYPLGGEVNGRPTVYFPLRVTTGAPPTSVEDPAVSFPPAVGGTVIVSEPP